MLCRWCGIDNSEHSQVCLHCGQALQPADCTSGPAIQTEPSIPAALPGPPEAQAADLCALAIDHFRLIQSSPAEPFTGKTMPVIAGMAALLAVMSGGTYYFTHRSSNIAEIVALERLAGTANTSPPSNTAEISSPERNAGGYSPMEQLPASAKTAAPDTPNSKIVAVPGSTQSQPAATAHPHARHVLPLKAKAAKSRFKAKFKDVFGQVVETRVYPSRKMWRQAHELWDRERIILEPDGSLTEKNIAPSNPSLIPGH